MRATASAAMVAVAAVGVVQYQSWRAERVDSGGLVEVSEFDTSSVEVRSLTRTVETDGTVVYDTPLAIGTPRAGTVLEGTSPGAEPASGDVLARIDDTAVVWLDGETPGWRPLDVGDEGTDVEQLESALVALGFDPDGEVTVDEVYTDATARLVERWQEAIGVEETGRVELGAAVFSSGRTRIAGTDVEVGDRVDIGPLMTIGTAVRIVEFEADPVDAATLAIGDGVVVGLRDGSTVAAVVTSIDRGVDVWSVTASVDAGDVPERDTLEVDVEWTVALADDVLTVPSSAVLRLDDGSYVVDVVSVDGSLERRTVTIGATSTTRIEVVAGLAVGDAVVVL